MFGMQQDKQHHFIYSLAIFMVLHTIFHSVIVAFVFSVIVGAGKEIKDWYFKDGTPEWGDLAYDVFGILLGVLIIGIGTVTSSLNWLKIP